MKHTKRGFTLIELLVVVLIVGILAAVAVPQYQRAVRRSRMAEVWSTMGSLRQALAVKMLEGPRVDYEDGTVSWNPANLDASISCTSASATFCWVQCPLAELKGCYYKASGTPTNPGITFEGNVGEVGNEYAFRLTLDNDGQSCEAPSGGDYSSICKELGVFD